jgi:hypothetical protein
LRPRKFVLLPSKGSRQTHIFRLRKSVRMATEPAGGSQLVQKGFLYHS